MPRDHRRLHGVLARSGLPVLLLALACSAARAEPAEGAGAELERRIGEIDALLARAHFHTALALARDSLARLDAAAPHPKLADRRARLEVMAATAEVALGQRDRARRSLVRALRAQPDMVFDERQISPKLLELAHQARRLAAAEEARP